MVIRAILLLMLAFIIGCKSDQETVQETAAVSANAELHFTAPDGWTQEQPKTKMRKAQFQLPGVDGAENAELTVFVFPGTGGTVEANLQRWFGQFKQPDGRPTASRATIVDKEVNNLKVSVVYLTGIYLKSSSMMMMGGEITEMADYAMLAAIVETPKDPWFFKTIGPQKTIDHWREDFDKFVQTFKYN